MTFYYKERKQKMSVYDLCEVQIIDPNLRRSYGSRAHYSREKAYRGQNAGLWRIIEDSQNPPKPVLKNQPILNEKINQNNTIVKEFLSIIIIALNNLHYTKICIESIRSYTDFDYQIILVDNGSKDDTAAWFIKTAQTEDILIRNQYNRGFSGANNQALNLAMGEYVLFLNNDTEIKKSGWVEPFFNSKDDADILGPTMRKLIVDYNDFSFVYAGEGHDQNPFCYLEGWCLFGKKLVFRALGGMDEQFNPAYSEDSDLSFKAIQAGFRIKKIHDVPIVHFGNKTSSQMNEMYGISIKNRRKLFNKWISKKHANILLIRKGAKGDVLMTTPVIRAVKKAYPESRIYFETQCPELIQGNPNIEQIISTSKKEQFDLIYELEYEAFPGEIRIDAMSRQVGIKLDNRKMEVFLDEPTKLPIDNPYVVFHTGKSWPNRELSIEKWAQIAEYLISLNYRIAEIGTSETENIPIDGIIDLRSQSWGFVSRLIREAEFFVGIDSACSNLAKALQTPAFIFYGCVNPQVMLADAVEYPIIAHGLDCIGCRDRSSSHYVECDKIEIFCCTKVKAQDIIIMLEQYIKSTKEKAA